MANALTCLPIFFWKQLIEFANLQTVQTNLRSIFFAEGESVYLGFTSVFKFTLRCARIVNQKGCSSSEFEIVLKVDNTARSILYLRCFDFTVLVESQVANVIDTDQNHDFIFLKAS